MPIHQKEEVRKIRLIISKLVSLDIAHSQISTSTQRKIILVDILGDSLEHVIVGEVRRHVKKFAWVLVTR